MKKEVLFILLNDYADWEGAFLVPSLNAGVVPGGPVEYIVKTLSLRKAPVHSLGGFITHPDYDLTDMPADYAGLVLIGGMGISSPRTVRDILSSPGKYFWLSMPTRRKRPKKPASFIKSVFAA